MCLDRSFLPLSYIKLFYFISQFYIISVVLSSHFFPSSFLLFTLFSLRVEDSPVSSIFARLFPCIHQTIALPTMSSICLILNFVTSQRR